MTEFAMVFPGQGSQSIRMLSEFAKHYSLVEKTFSEASSILDYDLWELIQEGSIRDLNRTWKAQPALLASSVAIWRIWQEMSKKKNSKFMAGHSLGEYSALVCSGILDFRAAIQLVAIRGILMQESVPENIGLMSAIIGLDNEIVIEICQKTEKTQIVAPASFNTKKQTVISGHKEAVIRASILCKEFGAKYVIPLSITVPSHCVLMKPAAAKLAKILEKIDFSAPIIPVVNNVDVNIERTSIAIRRALIRQLYCPVRWTETIQYLVSIGINLFLEIGPGNVLTNFNKHISKNISCISINNPISLSTAIELL